MGADGPGARTAVRFRALTGDHTAQPDRLYGRLRGHALRPRQQILLDQTLPRLRFPASLVATPTSAFAAPVRALWIEVGAGSFEHAEAQAIRNADIGLIACEVFQNGLCSLLGRLVPQGAEATGALPGNLRVWDDDARRLLRALPDACLDRFFLLFPDPWPKARHAKRRFLHPDMLGTLARVLRPGAMWHLATDDPTYQAWATEVLGCQSLFDVDAPATERPADWPGTRYEAKALKQHKRVLYWVIRRAPT